MTHSTPFPPEGNFGASPETAYGRGAANPEYTGYPAPDASYGDISSDRSTSDVAKDQAGHVAAEAADAGKHVAGVAQEQAQNVAGEVKTQAKDLFHQTKVELTDQASTQQKKVASGLRALGDELGTMAASSDNPGVASDLVRQVADRSESIASWLEDREPGHVLDEVTQFARRRPGAFLAIAAGAGLLAGRLGRGLTASNDDSTSGSGSQTPPTPSRFAPASEEYSGAQYSAEYVAPQYESPQHDAPRHDRSGYGVTPAQRAAQPGAYTTQPGYGQQPGYQPQPGYGQEPGYTAPPTGYQQ